MEAAKSRGPAISTAEAKSDSIVQDEMRTMIRFFRRPGPLALAVLLVFIPTVWIAWPRIATRECVEIKEVYLDRSTEDNATEKGRKRSYTVTESTPRATDPPARDVTLLCWVMTSPATLPTRGAAVNRTWLNRCDQQLFMSSETHDGDSRVIKIVSEEGRDKLPQKTMHAFKYLYDNYLNDSDWFMKADDDTYVVVENLKHLLAGYYPSEPIYFGHLFKPHVQQGYHSGGAGYVLSREALRRFGTQGFGRSDVCGISTIDEDVELGRCMEKLGVRPVSTVDQSGRSRFHGFSPNNHIGGVSIAGYENYDANGGKLGFDTVSDYVVTFHYVKPEEMAVLEFLMYRFKKVGLIEPAIGNRSIAKA